MVLSINYTSKYYAEEKENIAIKDSCISRSKKKPLGVKIESLNNTMHFDVTFNNKMLS